MRDGDDGRISPEHDKRSEPRERALEPARLLLERDGVVDALIVDRSMKGMRLRLPYGVLVAMSLTAFDLNRSTIYQVKVVWKAYPDIGVQLQSSFNVRTGEGAEAPAMRRLWFEATSTRR